MGWAERERWIESAMPGDEYPFPAGEPQLRLNYRQRRGGVIAKKILMTKHTHAWEPTLAGCRRRRRRKRLRRPWIARILDSVTPIHLVWVARRAGAQGGRDDSGVQSTYRRSFADRYPRVTFRYKTATTKPTKTTEDNAVTPSTKLGKGFALDIRQVEGLCLAEEGVEV